MTPMQTAETDHLAPFRAGGVIPAHPLVLNADRKLDERRQRALTRYYVDAGSSGIAVGVHTTQFAIREHGLFRPVLAMAAEEARSWQPRPLTLIAGVTGLTDQAVDEAVIAKSLDYNAALVNVAAWRGRPEDEILRHLSRVAEILPVIGFALLPRVGGIHLSYSFWRNFMDIPGVIGIKIATFDHYRTVDIVRALVDSRREDDIKLYTGNDDQIVLDLLSQLVFPRDGGTVSVSFSGGLLGHWSVWTAAAVALWKRIQRATDDERAALMALDAATTDANYAVYDGANDLAGAIPGCLDVLRRQGLVEGTWCLDPAEKLSPGQEGEISRVIAAYPELSDDHFVAANLSRWLEE